jgi:hypothetical protein
MNRMSEKGDPPIILFANAAATAILRAMFTSTAVFTGFASFGTSTGCVMIFYFVRVS